MRERGAATEGAAAERGGREARSEAKDLDSLWKGQGNTFFPRLSRRNAALQTLLRILTSTTVKE
jgi:hypothetical protein